MLYRIVLTTVQLHQANITHPFPLTSSTRKCLHHRQVRKKRLLKVKPSSEKKSRSTGIPITHHASNPGQGTYPFSRGSRNVFGNYSKITLLYKITLFKSNENECSLNHRYACSSPPALLGSCSKKIDPYLIWEILFPLVI